MYNGFQKEEINKTQKLDLSTFALQLEQALKHSSYYSNYIQLNEKSLKAKDFYQVCVYYSLDSWKTNFHVKSSITC